MKGLEQIPQVVDLEKAYALLQSTAISKKPVSPENLALWSQWARFDPRLAEQIVSHLAKYWKTFVPLALREELLHQPWPQAMGVLLLEAREQLHKKDRPVFRRWMSLVTESFVNAHGEQFFIGLRTPGGRLMFEDAARSHRSYLRWGYLGRERLISKAASFPSESSLLKPAIRRRILDDLLRSRHRITVRDYREALQWEVSPRVAELDLKAHPRLRAEGNTRGRSYRLIRRARSD